MITRVRLSAIGKTEKPRFTVEPDAGPDASEALKGRRKIFIPESRCFEEAPVYDGHKLCHGNRIVGPALIEQVNTTVFVSADFDAFCDPMGSFVVTKKGFEIKAAGGKSAGGKSAGGKS